MYQVGFSNDVIESFVVISVDTSDTSGLTAIEYPYDSLTEMLFVTVFSYWIDIFFDIYVDILYF